MLDIGEAILAFDNEEDAQRFGARVAELLGAIVDTSRAPYIGAGHRPVTVISDPKLLAELAPATVAG